MSTSPQDFSAQIIEGFITAHLAATVAGLPVYVHTIEHADGVVLVDTGMFDSTPELDEECEPVPMPENIPRDVVRVINTHLHFDHCGGNRLFPVCRSTSSAQGKGRSRRRGMAYPGARADLSLARR
jgi:glyoxylase-like metal-dependent hydrolase (beta-lactamase superfamily II)